MAEGFERQSCSFQQIKAQLDPHCVYVVFEKAAEGCREFACGEIKELLEPYREQILQQDLHHDSELERLFMVVKFDPRRSQSVRNILLSPKLPRDVVVYLYGHLASAEGGKTTEP